MIVYAQRTRTVRPKSLASLTDPLDALIEWGEVESAAADDHCPDQDALVPPVEAIRAFTLEAARVYWRGSGALARFDPGMLPATMEVRVPEGYAFYALYPRSYGQAAVRFWEQLRPRAAVVIGIRSIGTSLSAVVTAALEERGCKVESFTIRPRGHPFDRRLSIDSRIAARWRAAAEFGPAHFVVVDEGPGLSGSSFASVAIALRQLGVRDDRIVFLPAWHADGTSFLSEAAREEWSRHRRFVADDAPSPPGDDLSAGNWRRLFYNESDQPAAHPQHERRKYLCGRTLYKFAGLGRYGRAKWERACALADAGFIPRPLQLDNGYLASEFAAGRPVDHEHADEALHETVRRYLHFLEREFPAPREAPIDEIAEMVRVNVGEALGESWADRALARLKIAGARFAGGATCAIDGRILPHEWIATQQGYLKADALDHHDDHFFPGCQNIAWDTAGAKVELGFNPTRHISFYELAYLSYRVGYCTMAAIACHDRKERIRFQKLVKTYSHQLRRVIQDGRS
jgi:hypothetical protein